MWRPWEKKAEYKPPTLTFTEQELDKLVLERAQELAKKLIAALPTSKVEHVVAFSDLEEVEGYVVQEFPSVRGFEFKSPLVVTDRHDKALSCMRADPQHRRMRVVKLWRTPKGTLLWKVEAQVAWPAFEEVEFDGERYRK